MSETKSYYTIGSASADFAAEELADGIETDLTANVTIRRLNTRDRNRLFHMSTDFPEAGKELVTLQGTFHGENPDYYLDTKAEVCLDEKHGETVYSWCSCMDFSMNHYACSHTTALVCHYLKDRFGLACFEGSEARNLLARRMCVDDPFAPGALRPTNVRLLKLLGGTEDSREEENLPVWVKNPKPAPIMDGTAKPKRMVRAAAPLSVACEMISLSDGSAAVTVKAGPGKHYVIHDLQTLLESYRKDSPFVFSSAVRIPAGRDRYTEDSRKIMDFLSSEEQFSRRSHGGQAYMANLINGRNHLPLTGRDLDIFMEMMEGREILLSHESDPKNFQACTVMSEEKAKPLEADKTDFGLTVRMPEDMMLAGCGMDSMYLAEDSRIMKLPASQWQNWQVLENAVSDEGEIYIRNRDLPAILPVLLPISEETGLITFTGKDSSSYLPEKPEFQFYLDYPQENLISCQLRAHYPKLRKTYSVFDPSEDEDKRNLPAENEMARKCWTYFTAYDEKEKEAFVECTTDSLYHFLTETIPLLAEMGTVMVSKQMENLRVKPVGRLQVGIQVDGGQLLMSLKSDVLSEREMVEFLSAYNRKRKFTRLKGGTFIRTDGADPSILDTISDTYRNYGKKHPEAMKVPGFRAMYLDEMLRDKDAVSLQKDDAYKELLAEMADDGLDRPVPASLKDTLYPYQADGFHWISTLKKNRLGGILADDMGLGKTLQVISFLLAEQEEGKRGRDLRTLIIAPASLIYNWQHEIAKFAPSLRCRVIAGSAAERKNLLAALRAADAKEKQLPAVAGTDEKTSADSLIGIEGPVASGSSLIGIEGPVASDSSLIGIEGPVASGSSLSDREQGGPADIFITSYDLLKRDIAEYDGIHFANEIIDEAQYIKNHNTQAAKGVRLMDSEFRLALTGTPIENRLSELWSIFDYLMPGFLYTYSRFRSDYEAPVVNEQDEDTLNRLRAMVHPFILRRLKRDVLKDLPDKITETVSIRLENAQRKLYDSYAARLKMMLDKTTPEEFKVKKLAILAELMHLRQICCGPELFLENYKGDNAKKTACLELIRQAIDGGHKVLLFSQFTSVLDELGEDLNRQDIAFHRIDGSVSSKDRLRMVDSFQADDVPVFCISLKAGGTGLNLTAADIVIHYDPWWNKAAQNQATDRTHRVGQENTVTEYLLIAENTIEEQIQHMQESKAQLAEDILSGDAVESIRIDKDSLMQLL